MKLLAEISEASLGIQQEVEVSKKEYELRKSARAILLNADGLMAVQHLETYAFHKLPGGGVESNETVEEALRREVKEEVGCACRIERAIGVVIEYRTTNYNLIQISYAFLARITGEIGTPDLEACEREEGQETLWLPPEEVLRRMSSDIPGKPEGRFILARERAFLEEYLHIK